MTASAELKQMLPNTGMSEGDYVLGAQPRMFKKHKVLPRPTREAYPIAAVHNAQQATPRTHGLEVDTALLRSSSLQEPSPSLRRRSRRTERPRASPDPACALAEVIIQPLREQSLDPDVCC